MGHALRELSGGGDQSKGITHCMLGKGVRRNKVRHNTDNTDRWKWEKTRTGGWEGFLEEVTLKWYPMDE